MTRRAPWILMAVLTALFAAPPLRADGSASSVPAGSNPRGLALGDVTGDGVPDLVVANFGAPSFIGQNLPEGAQGSVQVFSPSPSGLQLKATAESGPGTRNVAVLPGGRVLALVYGSDALKSYRYKAGALSEAASVPAPHQCIGLAVGKRAGKPARFAAVCGYAGSLVSLYPLDGEGRPGARVDLPALPGATAAATGDLNGDGTDELAVACLGSDKILLYSIPPSGPLSGASGTATLTLPSGMGPADVKIADLDGDGRLDLVAACFAGRSAALMLQKTDGTFEAPRLTALSGQSPNGLTVASSAGGAVVAVAERDSDLVEVFRWAGGALVPVKSLAVESPAAAMGPVEAERMDVDGSGVPAWVVSHMRSGTLRVLRAAAEAASSGQPPLSEETSRFYPNPSKGEVNLQFSLDAASTVTVSALEEGGVPVWKTVIPGLPAGQNNLRWYGETDSKTPVPSGVYLLSVTDGTHAVSHPVTISR